jgi:hypothetical protein
VFIEMIDLLRCINDHEDSWLVASFRNVTNRFITDGTLGCPICAAKYEIVNGVADFSAGTALVQPITRALSARDREEVATRAGAFLNATEPGATVVLGGSWAEAAHELSVMTDSRVVALNPSGRGEESERVGFVRVAARIPLAEGKALGVALDAGFSADVMSSATRIVRPGGRIVAPASLPAPSHVSVLARDENYWVGEKAMETISLSRSKVSK